MKKLCAGFVVLFVLLVGVAAYAATIQVPTTGQTVSYAEGDDGALQAGRVWPSPRFTDNYNGTVTDNLTGLQWSRQANANVIGITRSWQQALADIKRLNAEGYLGYSDWRLPNLNELATLNNQGEIELAQWLGHNGFTGVATGAYWSSDTAMTEPGNAWVVSFADGTLTTQPKTAVGVVWAVRGVSVTVLATGQRDCFDSTGNVISCRGTGQDGELRLGVPWPAQRFISNGDGLVTDAMTGLSWSQDAALPSAAPQMWPEALGGIVTLNSQNYLGFSDWRLPNRNELLSLINYGESRIAQTLSASGFTGIQEQYWASGTLAADPARAWQVTITGKATPSGKYLPLPGSYVWPVRGGMPEQAVSASASSYAVSSSTSAPASKSVALAAAAATLSVSTASLPGGTTGSAYSQTLAATGGTTPYTWTKSAGTLPTGLALSTAGVISGTPTAAGTYSFTVQVKDKANATATKALSIVVTAAPLTITTTALVDGYLTTAYSQTLAATGGKTAYSWSITAGTLPAGLSLAASTGVISGTPTATVASTITVQVKDANATIVTKALTITTYALPAITTATLAGGSTGVTYSQTLAASGGKAPLTWSVSSGTLPVGLSLNGTTGVISGTPTTAVTSNVTFKVSDANAKTATKALSITVSTAPPTITTMTLASGVITVSYSQTLTASGGKTPYTWSKTAGTLPAGLTLSTSGVISGKPTATGTSNFTVQVKDGNNATASKAMSITIAPPLSITSTGLPEGSVGTPYSQPCVATGGKPPYAWSVISGSLPTGLELNSSSGLMSGTPTTYGWFDYTVQVKDANNSSASLTISQYIYPPMTISTTSLPQVYVGNPYTTTLIASGGTSPYSWTVAGGALPEGVLLNSSSGIISGVPATAGIFTFNIQARDSSNTTVSKELSLQVNSFGAISGTVTDPASGMPLAGVTVNLRLDYTTTNPDDRLYRCNNMALQSADYQMASANDGSKYACQGSTTSTALFKVRNPFSTKDPFTVVWNGIATLAAGLPEYLAQSFKPTRSGRLTKAGFYLPYALSTYLDGNVRILLKSRLGGDRGSYLAISSTVSIAALRSSAPGWVEFVFPTPVQVVAGQEYFLEINGTFFELYGGAYLYDLSWGDTAAYADGIALQRTEGRWNPAGGILAFRTYVDNLMDVAVTPSTGSFSMYGGNSAQLMASLYKPAIAGWGGIDINKNFLDSDGYGGGYNGDDLTASVTVAGNAADYYDGSGWLLVSASSWDQTWSTAITTDYVDVIFNRSYSAVTDASGAYTFPGLVDGSFSVMFSRPTYETKTITGLLTPGQTVPLTTQMVKELPAAVHGLVQLQGGDMLAGAGVTVTLTDTAGMHSTTTAADGSYRLDGLASGAYSITFSAPYLQTYSNTGTLAAGQDGTLNVWLTVNQLQVTVIAPRSDTVITTSQYTITGTALNTGTVTATITTASGVAVYQAVVVDNSFSINVPTELGRNFIDITAANNYSSRYITRVIVAPTIIVRDLGDSGNVARYEVDGNFDAKKQDGTINDQPRKAIAAEYFKTHADVDFLVYLTTFDYALLEATALGFYTSVRNDTQGINQPLFNNSTNYGSQGKLQGTIDLGSVSQLASATYGTKLDEILATLAHEVMHRYSSFVRYKNPDGSLNNALLGKDGSHWSYLLDTKGSLMLGSSWKNNNDGTFTSTSIRNSYSPLDLYLMGMIPKEQVTPMLLIDNPAIDKTKLPHLGDTISGTATTVTIDDIIAAEGARIPDYNTSQKQFTIGYALLSRSGDEITEAASAANIIRNVFPGTLAGLTHGRGSIADIPPSLELAIDTPAAGASVTGPELAVSGTFINSSGVTTAVTVNGIPALISGRRFIANHVPLQVGSNTLTITATDANGLSATTTRTITATTGHYLRLVAQKESGAAPLQSELALDGSFPITNVQLTTTGPAQITLTPGSTPTRYSVTLAYEGLYTITATATGPDGNTCSATLALLAQTEGTSQTPALTVEITSPAEGLTVPGPEVTVSGTITNSSGVRTTVTVNGTPATVTGNSYTISNLPLTQGSNTISVTATDIFGATTTLTRTITATTGASPLTIGIDTPADMATITGPDVTVQGTVINTTGAETGVTINGIPATVNGTHYIANHVPLQTGSNTLTITATDANGLTSTTSRTVTAATGNYIRISSNIDSGTGPLNINLRLDGSFPISNPQITVNGPTGGQVQQDTQSGAYTATFSVEGAYTITASVQGPDGSTYTDSVIITVVSRAQLETLLKGKWETVKTAVINNNYELALSHFVPGVREKFRTMFNDPDINITARLAEITRVEFGESKGKTAKLWAVKLVSGEEIAYLIKLVRDWSGNWKILGF